MVDGRLTCQLVPTRAGALVRVVQPVRLDKPEADWTVKPKSDPGHERTIFSPLREALRVGLADN